MAQGRRQVAIGHERTDEAARGAVPAPQPATAIDGEERVGQAVDDGLGGDLETSHRLALAPPHAVERLHAGGELLGRGRQNESRHVRLAATRQGLDVAREAHEGVQVAAHDDGGAEADRRHRAQRAIDRQPACRHHAGQHDHGRRQHHGIGDQVAPQRQAGFGIGHRSRLYAARSDIVITFPRRGKVARSDGRGMSKTDSCLRLRHPPSALGTFASEEN